MILRRVILILVGVGLVAGLCLSFSQAPIPQLASGAKLATAGQSFVNSLTQTLSSRPQTVNAVIVDAGNKRVLKPTTLFRSPQAISADAAIAIVRHRAAVAELDQALRAHHINDNALFYEVLDHLQDPKATGQILAAQPDDLNQALVKMLSATQALQKLRLEADGESENSLKPHTAKFDFNTEARIVQLNKVRLAPDVQGLVDRVAAQEDIHDGDILELVQRCHSSKDCIEKSGKTLLDAQHLLKEKQFRILEKAMN